MLVVEVSARSVAVTALPLSTPAKAELMADATAEMTALLVSPAVKVTETSWLWPFTVTVNDLSPAPSASTISVPSLEY